MKKAGLRFEWKDFFTIIVFSIMKLNIGREAMNNVQAHYENLLAEHYTWMFGDYMSKVQDNITFFQKQKILPQGNARSIDLGCGSGFQSIALADIGFWVLSVDYSQLLLKELETHRENRTIKTVQADLLNFNQYYFYDAPEVIICMGDTLTHLDSFDSIITLLERVTTILDHGGRFIITYRDMTQELTGLDRFIPLRSDKTKIMTTFLEYQPEYVVVHDLIYIKSNNNWDLHKSSYKKLRLNIIWLKEQFTTLGMNIEYEGTEQGFTILIASKI